MSGIDPAVERVKEDLAAELREIGNWFALYADESDRATTAFLAAARIERLEEENDHLRDENTELREQPWLKWAEAILKKMIEFGAADPRDGEYDLAEIFEEWLDGYEQANQATIARLETKLTSLANAEANYRLQHDRHGDGHRETGRAWDLMRRSGEAARQALGES